MGSSAEYSSDSFFFPSLNKRSDIRQCATQLVSVYAKFNFHYSKHLLRIKIDYLICKHFFETIYN